MTKEGRGGGWNEHGKSCKERAGTFQRIQSNSVSVWDSVEQQGCTFNTVGPSHLLINWSYGQREVFPFLCPFIIAKGNT